MYNNPADILRRIALTDNMQEAHDDVTSSGSTQRNPSDYTIGWICALTTEQTAARAMLDEIHTESPYIAGSMSGHNIVIACLPMGKIGTNSAAITITELFDKFPSIKFCFMVGIGGGVPSSEHDIRLGDVVVGTPVAQYSGVVQYDMGKAMQGKDTENTGALNHPPRELLEALNVLKTRHTSEDSEVSRHLEHLGAKWTKLSPQFSTSENLTDVLFAPDTPHQLEPKPKALTDTIYFLFLDLVSFVQLLLGLTLWQLFNPRGSEENKSGSLGHPEIVPDKACRFCDTKKILDRQPRDMMVHYGLIASGNLVIKDAKKRDHLNKAFGGHVLCVEMEAAGLLEKFPCLVIRGICDYADAHKNKAWQPYTAAVAAAYTKELLSVLPREHVQNMTNALVFQKLGDLFQTTNKIKHEQELPRILDWLSPLNYDEQQHRHIHTEHLQQAEWLLDSPHFQDLLFSEEKMMFCHGFPGVGKTLLTSMVIQYIQQNLVNCKNQQRFDQETARVGVAFIYYSSDKQQEQRPIDVLGSIMKQLTQNLPFIPQSMKDLEPAYGNIPAASRANTSDVLKDFTNALKSLISGCYLEVFIVVDALDENQDAETLLHRLIEIQDKAEAKLFATSRPNLYEQIFSGGRILDIHANSHDVCAYINSRMEEFDVIKYEVGHLTSEDKNSIKHAIINKVTEAANGIFLLAFFHMNFLKEMTTANEVLQALEELPRGENAFDETYKKTIDRIGGLVQKHRRIAKRVLEWMICAVRPVTILELQHALATEPGQEPPTKYHLQIPQVIVRICMGLVFIEKESGIVRLLHQTTREYFTHNIDSLSSLEESAARRNGEAPKQGLRDCHRSMATTCVAYVSFDAFSTYTEGLLYELDNAFQQRLESYPFYGYAANFWAHHAEQALADDSDSLVLKELLVNLSERQANVSGTFEATLRRFDADELYHVPIGMVIPHVAAYLGLERLLAFFIDAEKNLEIKNSHGRSPLSFAAEEGHQKLVCKLILNGADPNSISGEESWLLTKSRQNRTPLSLASENGHLATVACLLESPSILVNKDDGFYRTPYYFAVQGGHSDVADILQSHGGGFAGSIRCRDDNALLIDKSEGVGRKLQLQTTDNVLIIIDDAFVAELRLIRRWVKRFANRGCASEYTISLPFDSNELTEMIGCYEYYKSLNKRDYWVKLIESNGGQPIDERWFKYPWEAWAIYKAYPMNKLVDIMKVAYYLKMKHLRPLTAAALAIKLMQSVDEETLPRDLRREV